MEKKSSFLTGLGPSLPSTHAQTPSSSEDITQRNELSLTLVIHLDQGGHLLAALLSYALQIMAPQVFKQAQENLPKLKPLVARILELLQQPKNQPIEHPTLTFKAQNLHRTEKTAPTLTIFIKSIDSRVELKILAEGHFNPDLLVEYMRFLLSQLEGLSNLKATLDMPQNADANQQQLGQNFAEFFIRGVQIEGSSTLAREIINKHAQSGQLGWVPRFMPLGPDGKPIKPGQPGNNTSFSGPRV